MPGTPLRDFDSIGNAQWSLLILHSTARDLDVEGSTRVVTLRCVNIKTKKNIPGLSREAGKDLRGGLVGQSMSRGQLHDARVMGDRCVGE